MAEKPILFNTEMVKAILDGRKTQTRRLVKEILLDEQHFTVKGGVALACDGSGYWYRAEKFCRVQPGDVLWVRETWCNWWLPHGEWRYIYKATSPHGNTAPAMPDSDDEPFTMPWRPSIHMPKEAARLFLRVTGVRIERLQDITPMGIKAEGVKVDEADEFDVEVSPEAMERFAFEELWDSTVKPADLHRYGWEANPWVWVIEFERLDEKPAGLWADRDTAQFGDKDVLMPAT